MTRNEILRAPSFEFPSKVLIFLFIFGHKLWVRVFGQELRWSRDALKSGTSGTYHIVHWTEYLLLLWLLNPDRRCKTDQPTYY